MGSWEIDLAERTAICCRPNEPEPGNTGGGKKMKILSKLQTKQPKSENLKPLEKNRNTIFSTKILAEIIVFVAMGGALALISHSFFGLPQGGSINLGMVPIFWLALRRGPKIGIFAGAVLALWTLQLNHSLSTLHSSFLIIRWRLPALGSLDSLETSKLSVQS